MWASMAVEMGSRGFGASKVALRWWCAAIAVLSLALPTSGQGCKTDLTGKVTKFSTANLVCRTYTVDSGHTFDIWVRSTLILATRNSLVCKLLNRGSHMRGRTFRIISLPLYDYKIAFFALLNSILPNLTKLVSFETAMELVVTS